MILPGHIRSSMDAMIREFDESGRTPRESYAAGWDDAIAQLQPENRRLKKLLDDIRAEVMRVREEERCLNAHLIQKR